jgi:hypothetical protein
MDASMKSDELLPPVHPQHVLTFPLVSMEKTLHFLLSEPVDDHFDKVSVVTLNMNTRRVVSIKR